MGQIGQTSGTARVQIANLGTASYLGARKLAEDRGMALLKHPLLDDIVSKPHLRRALGLVHYTGWSNDLLAYPASGNMFISGLDACDSSIDRDTRTRWVLPAEYIPYEAKGRPNIGLYLVPSRFETAKCGMGQATVVHPRRVFVLEDFPQGFSTKGVADSLTRIPVSVSVDAMREADPSLIGTLLRIEGSAVRPISRSHTLGFGTRVVAANSLVNEPLEVFAMPLVESQIRS